MPNRYEWELVRYESCEDFDSDDVSHHDELLQIPAGDFVAAVAQLGLNVGGIRTRYALRLARHDDWSTDRVDVIDGVFDPHGDFVVPIGEMQELVDAIRATLLQLRMFDSEGNRLGVDDGEFRAACIRMTGECEWPLLLFDAMRANERTIADRRLIRELRKRFAEPCSPSTALVAADWLDDEGREGDAARIRELQQAAGDWTGALQMPSDVR